MIAGDRAWVVGPRALGWLLAAAVAVYQLSLPRVLGGADESVVLYGAKRVLDGQALYRDVFEFITPGSFYFFAGIFALSGPSLLAARVAMAVINAVSCVLLFALARRVAGAAEAAVAVVLFAATCLPAWPYASPHWLSTALCLGTATAVLGERQSQAGRARVLLAGALAALTFCVQQQQGVVLAGWLAVTLVAGAWPAVAGGGWRRVRHDLGCALVAWLLVAGVVLGYSAWRASVAELVYAIFTFVFQRYSSFHADQVSWAGVCALCGKLAPLAWPWLLQGYPVALAAEAVAVGLALRHRRGNDEVTRGCLVLLAAVMAGSILYYPDFIHVAFIAPFGLVLAARIARGVCSMALWQPNRLLRLVPQVALLLLAVAAMNKGWSNWRYAWQMAPEEFESAVGTLRGEAKTRALLQAVRQAFAREPQAPRTLFTYPSDPWLYLAVPADNPTPFSFLLRDYNTPAQVEQALRAVAERDTAVLVINAGFVAGDDPVVRLQRQRHYQRVAEVGPYAVYGRQRTH
ncbi:MAG: hypothetical protein HY699_22050 [Deltaproteobacteria bacterium]|nr:hypothetical protein [Deltaproteobacteria bacterium]